jgi:hypothetical protein
MTKMYTQSNARVSICTIIIDIATFDNQNDALAHVIQNADKVSRQSTHLMHMII